MIKIKITIDTKEDSHEEIRKVIRMLSSLVGEKEIFENKGNIFESDKETPNLFGMFDNKQQEKKGSIIETIEDDKTEIPEVVEYS